MEMKKVATVFGTRPEIIKLAPVIQAIEGLGTNLKTVNITSSQHTDLLYPLIDLFGIRIDRDLHVMQPDQTPSAICSRVLTSMERVLDEDKPDCVIVQGDTSTALAAALAAFHRKVPVAHVEAGLRSGCVHSPFPEEMNRRLITRIATWHFAATDYNRDTLLDEGVKSDDIFVTGNPVVDALHMMLSKARCSDYLRTILKATDGSKMIVLTTHRRESFGGLMAENLRVLRRFVETHKDVSMIFPVHPNPNVLSAARQILKGAKRVYLVEPLRYEEFVHLLAQSWLIVSDSGGVQEEAPTLHKPLLVLRENTERQEALSCGIARLVGGKPEILAQMLDETYRDGAWIDQVRRVRNPFGNGDAGERIAGTLAQLLNAEVGSYVLSSAA